MPQSRQGIDARDGLCPFESNMNEPRG